MSATQTGQNTSCVLAIDPGTHCGWALGLPGGILSGTWELKPRRFEGAGMRWVRLRRFLDELAATASPEMVVVEEVRRHLGTDAAHIYGGIIAVVQAWCEERGIPYSAIPVGTIKKHATGRGNADKAAMIAAAVARWPEQLVADDNQADALWILDCAISQYASPGSGRVR